MVTLPPKETPETRQRTLEIFAAAIERVSGGTTDASRSARLAAETGERTDVANAKRQFDKLTGPERREVGRVAKDLAEEMRAGAKVVQIVENLAADEEFSLEVIWPR